MKNTLVSLCILLCITLPLTGQSIRVVDATNLQPVSDVFIFSNLKSTLTLEKGRADLSIFKSSDTLYFQHPAYKTKSLTKAAIIESGGMVLIEEDLLKMNEVLVSVNRWEQERREIPNKIEAVKAKEAEFYNPQTTADLVALSDQVYVQKSQLGGGSPMIRGFAANRVLLVVDGVRLNNAIYRSGNLQNIISLDTHVMENAEVIFGPGSIIYGSDAMGGVMDFHTRHVKLSTSDQSYFRFNALSRYSSSNFEKTGHFDVSYGKKRWGLLTSVSFSDYGDLRMGNQGGFEDYEQPFYVRVLPDRDTVIVNDDPSLQIGSGFSQVNVMQKIRFRPSKSFDVNYAFHYSRSSDIPRYDRLIQIKDEQPKYAEWYYGPTQWIMHSLSVSMNDSTPLFDQLKITLAYQAYSESRHDRQLGMESIRERFEYLDIASFNADASKRLIGKNELFYGLEWATNRVFSVGASRNIYSGDIAAESSRYPDGGSLYINSGLYAGLKRYINQNLTLVTGLRGNYVNLQSRFVSKQFYDFPFSEINLSNLAFNGSAGLAWLPMRDLQVNANLSTGFRAPNLDDVGKVFDSEPGQVIVPNENLKPEYAVNGDVGFIYNISSRAKIDVTGFYSYLFDAMVRRPFTFNGQDSIYYDGEYSQVEALVNADWAQVYGVSTSFNWQLMRQLYLKSSITLTRGKDSGGFALRHAAPTFGATHLIYQTKKLKADLYVRYNGAKRHEDMPPSELSKPYMYTLDEFGNLYAPGWYTVNLSVAYQFKPFLQINAGIENILDRRYRSYSSGIAAPGRNFVVTIRTSI